MDDLPALKPRCDALGGEPRELAAKTGTPLVIYSEGKIKKLTIPPKQIESRSK